jgi:hypothetical protein
MKRKVIRVNGTLEDVDVGEGWESWNAAIGARVGQIVRADSLENFFYGPYSEYCDKELWCDEEALLTERPLNPIASLIADQAIFGDVIVFEQGDIT